MYRDEFGVPRRQNDTRIFELTNFGVTPGDGAPVWPGFVPHWLNPRHRPAVGAYFKNAAYEIHLSKLPQRPIPPPKPCCCMRNVCKIEIIFWFIGFSVGLTFLAFCGWKFNDLWKERGWHVFNFGNN